MSEWYEDFYEIWRADHLTPELRCQFLTNRYWRYGNSVAGIDIPDKKIIVNPDRVRELAATARVVPQRTMYYTLSHELAHYLYSIMDKSLISCTEEQFAHNYAFNDCFKASTSLERDPSLMGRLYRIRELTLD